MIKAYTDINQSKMLAEILSPESADMWLGCIGESMTMCHVGNYLLELQCRQDIDYRKTQPKIICPCWSLAALLEIIPVTIERDGNRCRLRIDKSEKDFDIWYEEVDSGLAQLDLDIITPNIVDACVEMIEKLHNEKLTL